uniref:ubinuclein-1-like n=1 Tax=Myxine glutinosa TaxID=7769 RepID=UPI00358EC068
MGSFKCAGDNPIIYWIPLNKILLNEEREKEREEKIISEDDEDEEKPGRRIFGPRKKFHWNEELRDLLCDVVKTKIACYEPEKNNWQSAEDYLKAFLEAEVKSLWPKGWMQNAVQGKSISSWAYHFSHSQEKSDRTNQGEVQAPDHKNTTTPVIAFSVVLLYFRANNPLVCIPPPVEESTQGKLQAVKIGEGEGKQKTFQADINNILMQIETQAKELNAQLRTAVFAHLASFLPCANNTLTKMLKKIHLNEQDGRLTSPLQKLRDAIASAMPEQMTKYQQEYQAHTQAKLLNEEREKEREEKIISEDDEDEEKPGRRIFGPRKKFHWNEELRDLLCDVVKTKIACYEPEKNNWQSAEDYLKAFLEAEVKSLWPKGWMQARMLFKESRSVHGHITSAIAKKKVIAPTKVKFKEPTVKPERGAQVPLSGVEAPVAHVDAAVELLGVNLVSGSPCHFQLPIPTSSPSGTTSVPLSIQPVSKGLIPVSSAAPLTISSPSSTSSSPITTTTSTSGGSHISTPQSYSMDDSLDDELVCNPSSLNEVTEAIAALKTATELDNLGFPPSTPTPGPILSVSFKQTALQVPLGSAQANAIQTLQLQEPPAQVVETAGSPRELQNHDKVSNLQISVVVTTHSTVVSSSQNLSKPAFELSTLQSPPQAQPLQYSKNTNVLAKACTQNYGGDLAVTSTRDPVAKVRAPLPNQNCKLSEEPGGRTDTRKDAQKGPTSLFNRSPLPVQRVTNLLSVPPAPCGGASIVPISATTVLVSATSKPPSSPQIQKPALKVPCSSSPPCQKLKLSPPNTKPRPPSNSTQKSTLSSCSQNPHHPSPCPNVKSPSVIPPRIRQSTACSISERSQSATSARGRLSAPTCGGTRSLTPVCTATRPGLPPNMRFLATNLRSVSPSSVSMTTASALSSSGRSLSASPVNAKPLIVPQANVKSNSLSSNQNPHSVSSQNQKSPVASTNRNPLPVSACTKGMGVPIAKSPPTHVPGHKSTVITSVGHECSASLGVVPRSPMHVPLGNVYLPMPQNLTFPGFSSIRAHASPADPIITGIHGTNFHHTIAHGLYPNLHSGPQPHVQLQHSTLPSHFQQIRASSSKTIQTFSGSSHDSLFKA